MSSIEDVTTTGGPSSQDPTGEAGKEGQEAVAEGEAGEEVGADLTEEERQEMLLTAQAAKERGNDFFKAGDSEQAIECYTEAIDASPPGAPELAVFFANRAAAYSKV